MNSSNSLFLYFLTLTMISCGRSEDSSKNLASDIEIAEVKSKIDSEILNTEISTGGENKQLEFDSAMYDAYVDDNLNYFLKREFKEWYLPPPKLFDTFWFNEYKTDSTLVSLTNGDFNCDQIKDYALYLINDQNQIKTLFLHGTSEDSFEIAKEMTRSPIPGTIGFGLLVGEPGLYTSIEPQRDEDPVIQINCYTITQISFEKSAKTYFWDGSKYEVIYTGD